MNTSMMFSMRLKKSQSYTAGKWQGHYTTRLASFNKEGPTWAREGRLLLVIKMDRNLEERGISIQITEEEMPCQPFEHLVNEGEGEMIFPGGLIQYTIINTHSSPHHSPSRNELVALIFDDSHPTLLGNYLNWTHQLTI